MRKSYSSMYESLMRAAVAKMRREQRIEALRKRLFWKLARQSKQLSCN